ncbi:MAG: leucine--tRNA ligase [Chthonomonadaceae bacterium]|nr:leucine--tRNA ligase [Chthonomonadaceae bacterium]
MLQRYEPDVFESKWRQRWAEAELFKTRDEPGRPKFYGLDFFPYPSGAGLSVGHCRNYIPTDVLCRMKYMQGYNVLHPMGFDAFGLPAENEAIKNKSHPAPMIDKYAATYKRQMDLVGISYDWSRSFKSCDPNYYRWTQWIFRLLFERGLAYRQSAEVNWCPKDKTALANEEVLAGNCERCGTPVIKKAIPQWYFKITDYAQRLLDDLDDLDWPEGIKNQQRNWIGRSEGVQFKMRVVFEGIGPAVVGTNSDPPGSQVTSELDILMQEVAQETRSEQSEDPRVARFQDKLDEAARHVHVSAGISSAEDAMDAMRSKVSERLGDDIAVKLSKDDYIEVFTTRIDTIFGVTFCVIAPEHPLLESIKKSVSEERKAAIESYQASSKNQSDAVRQAEGREKTGVFTGAFAMNPVTGQSVPIWIADYVLMGYGTGAIMAVPAGDERDFEFAVKFDIPVRAIQEPDSDWLMSQARFADQATLDDYRRDPKLFKAAFVSKSKPLIDAKEYTGMDFETASKALGEWMEACGLGSRRVNFRLRDWLISRQRYWGCPIPVCYDKDGQVHLIPSNQLPVELPDVESYEPSDDGTSPLSQIQDFVNCTTPDGSLGRRETDTMGGFACSSWYFLRFCDPHNDDKPWDKARVDSWMPVDAYVGGAEHAVMHLLYARFWTKVLYDAGLVSVKEPFAKLRNQGQVLGRTPYRKPKANERLDIGEDGVLVSYAEAESTPASDLTWKWVRMSKSKGNVVTPDQAVEGYGADALRLFELFVAPIDADVEWDDNGMVGTARFLSRVFAAADTVKALSGVEKFPDKDLSPDAKRIQQDRIAKIRLWHHKTVKKCGDHIEAFKFNTYVAAMMEYMNETGRRIMEAGRAAGLPSGGPSPTQPVGVVKKPPMTDSDRIILSESHLAVLAESFEAFVLLLAPAAPHTADEVWEGLGKTKFTYEETWPNFNPEFAVDDVVTIAIQVNGKLRDTLEMPIGATDEEMKATALTSEKVQPHLDGKSVKKVVVVKGRLVNVVAV